MLTSIAAVLAFAQAAPSSQPETDLDLLRRAAVAAERSADAAERTAKAAETAAGIVNETKKEEPAKAPPLFTGQAGLSFVAMTGNSNAITGSLNTALSFNLKPWTIGVKAIGAYGRSKAADDTEFKTNALNISAEIKGARNFTDLLGIYTLGGYGMDHIAKVDWRAYGELGVQLTFFKKVEGDLVKLQLISELGARYQRESWYQFYPTFDTPIGGIDNPTPNILAIKVSADFRYAVNKYVVFNERLDLLPDVLTPENFVMSSLTGLSVKLIGPLSLTASFLLKFDNLPPPGAQKLDTVLAIGADVTF